MKFKLNALFLLLFAVGCSTTNSGFSKPDLSQVRAGMAKQEVLAILGKADNVAMSPGGRAEILEYGWDVFMDGIVGSAEWFYVRMVDGHVESFGHKGDFDTTKNPTVDYNINQKVTTDTKGTPSDSASSSDFTSERPLLHYAAAIEHDQLGKAQG